MIWFVVMTLSRVVCDHGTSSTTLSNAVLEAIQLMEEDQVGIDSLACIPERRIRRPNGNVRAIVDCLLSLHRRRHILR